MKKALSLLVLWVMVAGFPAISQRSELVWSFSATTNGSPVDLDSIFIENLTQGCDTVLYAPVHSFSFSYSTGLDELPDLPPRLFSQGIYPNPSRTISHFTITMESQGQLELLVTDGTGRIWSCFQSLLSCGDHGFEFIPGGESFYYLQARAEGASECIKLVSLGGNEGPCRLVYQGFQTPPEKKSSPAEGHWIFRPSDQINFIAYAQATGSIPGSDYIQDTPGDTETYEFVITNGLRCKAEPLVVYGGKNYYTVQLGDLCWLRENLDIGESLVLGVNDMNNDGIVEKYCYNDDPANCEMFGALYQWQEAMQYDETSGGQGICPPGWHIPTTLEFYLTALEYGGWINAGGVMKSLDLWASPNTGATNMSGYTGLPGGLRVQPTTPFGDMFTMAYFWSSDGQSGSSADSYWLEYGNAGLSHFTGSPTLGMAVRCIRNQ